MSVDKQGIHAPVSIQDVRDTLGASSYNLGTLSLWPTINKWSLHKPVRYNQVAPLSDEQFYEANAGISIPFDENLSSEQAITRYKQGVEWSYLRPTNYFRLTDFVEYRHNANKPFGCDFAAIAGVKDKNGNITTKARLRINAVKNLADIDIYRIADLQGCGWVVLQGENIYGMSDKGTMEYPIDGEGLSMEIESTTGGDYVIAIMKPNGKMYLIDSSLGTCYYEWTPTYTEEGYNAEIACVIYAEVVAGSKNKVYFSVDFSTKDGSAGHIQLSTVYITAYKASDKVVWQNMYTANTRLDIPASSSVTWLTDEEDQVTYNGKDCNLVIDESGEEVAYYRIEVFYETSSYSYKDVNV